MLGSIWDELGLNLQSCRNDVGLSSGAKSNQVLEDDKIMSKFGINFLAVHFSQTEIRMVICCIEMAVHLTTLDAEPAFDLVELRDLRGGCRLPNARLQYEIQKQPKWF